jgi:conjugal transfer pilus assembly protein TraA
MAIFTLSTGDVRMKFNQQHKQLLVLATLCLVVTEPALAGADATFSSVSTLVKDWMEGSLGKLFAFGALGTGLGITIVKQSLMPVVVGVGVSIATYYGPGVLNTVVAATL